MKKLLLTLALTITLSTSTAFTQTQQPQHNNRQIPISQIEILQGVISTSNSPEYTYINTVDGNGWAIYHDPDFQVDDKVIVLFDNMGTNDIYDDEIIRVIKVIL